MKKIILLIGFILLMSVNLQAKDFEATLQWDANSEPDLAGYNVYRSEISGADYILRNLSLILHPTTTFTDTFSVPDGEIKTYYYVVTAVDTSQLESDYSNEVNDTFNGNEAPLKPSNVTITIQVVIKVDTDGNVSIAMNEIK